MLNRIQSKEMKKLIAKLRDAIIIINVQKNRKYTFTDIVDRAILGDLLLQEYNN